MQMYICTHVRMYVHVYTVHTHQVCSQIVTIVCRKLGLIVFLLCVMMYYVSHTHTHMYVPTYVRMYV